jgi:hypothetical protein
MRPAGAVSIAAKTGRRGDMHRPKAWQCVAAAMVLLFLATGLLTHRVSTLVSMGSEGAGLTTGSRRSASGFPAPTPAASSDSRELPAATRRPPSEVDFIAPDFVNHLNPHAQDRTNPHNGGLRPRVQSSLKPKRVVVD